MLSATLHTSPTVFVAPHHEARLKKAQLRAEEEISGGKLMIDVYYLGIYIHSESHNICDETSCPVTTGDFVLSHKESLPGFTPPGSYKLKMKMVDAAGKQLTCISFGFSIGAGSSVADN